ncbi:hypothetical protein Sjap_002924 [Stephania japonica]|uniref:Wax synthase domain-containing protein n=1 Tax=Stephania japonica TaxID=461633 RepID=A0AAP0KQ54_9MAGN
MQTRHHQDCFLSYVPNIALFALLPLPLFPSPHLCGIIAFVTWLANLKLVAFAFDKGPLSSSKGGPISLIQFISIASLPNKTKQSQYSLKSPLNYALKFLVFAVVFPLYANKSLHHYNIILLALYMFNEPYLSTSLQDFWGRRWNLMVGGVLRSSVYEPVRRSIAEPVMGERWGSAFARVATFAVSGLMHEFVYFYWTKVEPTWEVSWFFLVNGVCTAVEVLVKKSELGEKWRLNKVVSGVLTIGFVKGTGVWLLFPQVVRNGLDLRMIEEYRTAFQFLKHQVLWRRSRGRWGGRKRQRLRDSGRRGIDQRVPPRIGGDNERDWSKWGGRRSIQSGRRHGMKVGKMAGGTQVGGEGD